MVKAAANMSTAHEALSPLASGRLQNTSDQTPIIDECRQDAAAPMPPQPLAQSEPEPASSVFSLFAARTMVIIPAHNEEECVGNVVRRLRERGFHHIRVVDNGSTDRTFQAAQKAGANAIHHPGTGYGLACWVGSLDLPEVIEWLLFCNADASDDFSAYDRFAELADAHDLILGARTHPNDRRHMSAPQRFGNWLAPALIHLLWGHRFDDLGPQRAIRVSALSKVRMSERGFGWTVEMQVRAVEQGLRIAEIPVRSFPRPAGRSKISGNVRGSLAAGWVILTTIARLRLTPLRTVGLRSP